MQQQNRIIKYHNIYLAPKLKKNYEAKRIVLDSIFAKKVTQKKALSLQTTQIEPIPNKLNSLHLQGYYFEDSDGIIFKTLDLFYHRYKLYWNTQIAVDAGIFQVKEPKLGKRYGSRYGISLFYNNFMFRLGVNKFQKFLEFVPTLQYHNIYKNHSYILEYTRQNALFYTYRICPVDNKITTDHFSVSDYITFSDKTSIWTQLYLNAYSNSDNEITGQFDYNFYNNFFLSKKLTYALALDGWYTSHSKATDCFYSPSFYDSTYIRINPQYYFGKFATLKAMAGIGYSFVGQDFLYKYGLWLQGTPLNDFTYNIGCMQSNSAHTASTTAKGYSYTECKANLGYNW